MWGGPVRQKQRRSFFLFVFCLFGCGCDGMGCDVMVRIVNPALPIRFLCEENVEENEDVGKDWGRC